MTERLKVVCVTITITCGLMLLIGMLALFVIVSNDVHALRRESQNVLKESQAAREAHDTLFDQERRAFDTMLRDHEATMQRLQGR